MLNVNTKKGREAEENIRKAILTIKTHQSNFAWFPTHNHFPIDGFIIEGNDITAIFEGKARQAGYKDGNMEYGGRNYSEYLVTTDKLNKGIELAKQMGINFYLIVLMQHTNHLLVFEIFNIKKNEVIPFQNRRTRTRAGVNGGSAIRENAYIDIKYAKVIELV